MCQIQQIFQQRSAYKRQTFHSTKNAKRQRTIFTALLDVKHYQIGL